MKIMKKCICCKKILKEKPHRKRKYCSQKCRGIIRYKNPLNIIILCRKCHNRLHEKKKRRKTRLNLSK